MGSEHHILNLGAGVQSTALYLLSMEGKVRPFDCAIFADTGDEPHWVYEHLGWLQSLGGPTINIRKKSDLTLSQSLLREEFRGRPVTYRDHHKHRFATIPAYTMAADGKKGMVQRQCTKEYKIEVIERFVRREVVGLKPKQRIPKTIAVHQYHGISIDEASRSTRIYERSLDCSWLTVHFPLIELGMDRTACVDYLTGKVPHDVQKSACRFCPFHDNRQWQELMSDAGERAAIIQVDRALRTPGIVANRGLDSQLFLHRACKPIDEIDFAALSIEDDKRRAEKQRKADEGDRIAKMQLQLEWGLEQECEGMCGA